ncbi:response regulator [Roseateles sp.]|uniref:response regulator n=1 Tax=Roseateles sp. TaxID=1971397 RepID=UPI0025ED5A34|nr:response regulator [Roseateles sp.]MBV8035066.1 response regulator [Roseateles sp.]
MTPGYRHTVLVVEDEGPIRQLLVATLAAEGFLVQEAGSATEGIAIAATRRIDLFLVDLGLPDLDGQVLIRRLRASSQRPILVLSARSNETDKVAALDAGADDYLVKPFSIPELHARLRAALRRTTRNDAGLQQLRIGDVLVDLDAMTVMRADVPVRLTATQWRLLAVLAKSANRVVTSQALLREVWGPHQVEQGHYLRIYMRQLRQRLEADATQPRYLLTEPGLGYRLVIDA